MFLLASLLGTTATATAAVLPSSAVEATSSLEHANDWSPNELLRAALEASGERDPGKLTRYVARFDELAAELKKSISPQATTVERAQAVVDFLHRRILTGGYDAECHDPRRALDAGQFNCVGSSLLFHCLAERCGLDVHAVLVTGHVWCRVTRAEGDFDVETTSRGWRLGENNRTTSDATNAGSRELDAAALVALIHYNHSVVELQSGRFAEAATAARAALELDPAAELARNNLAAAYNNWAVELAEAHDHEGALKLLAIAREIAPHDERLIANARRLYARSYESHFASGEFVQATTIVAAAIGEFPGDAYFASAQNALLVRTWLQSPYGALQIGLIRFAH